VVGCGSKTNQATTSTSEGKTSSAPSGQEAANAKVALVRFVDAIPEGHASLTFGNTPMFSDIGYKTVTPYKEVPGERHEFKLTTDHPARQAQPVTNSEGLSNGARYTVVAGLDKNGNEKLDVINDNLSAPADGKSKMRVINASDTEVDLYAPVKKNGNGTEGSADRARQPSRVQQYSDEDKWFSGVNAISSTSFKDVQPYDGQLDIVPSNHPKNRAVTKAVHLPVDVKAGDLYTVVVAGGTRRHPLEAIKIEDHLNPTSTAADANPNR